MTSPIVSTYQLVASNGRPIRKATKVTFADGREVRFTERMSKREALRQAAVLAERERITVAAVLENSNVREVVFVDGSKLTQTYSEMRDEYTCQSV